MKQRCKACREGQGLNWGPCTFSYGRLPRTVCITDLYVNSPAIIACCIVCIVLLNSMKVTLLPDPGVNLILEHAGSKGERLLVHPFQRGSPCYYQSYNDALCTTPRRDWSISHCNEVAHRLHQWQSIYRFNLYNERNLFLSATCVLPGMDLSKASREWEKRVGAR